MATRTVCSSANLALGGVAAFGWMVFVAWTGAGPNGWQARVCSDLELRPAACIGVGPGKDQGRISPYTRTARAPA